MKQSKLLTALLIFAGIQLGYTLQVQADSSAERKESKVYYPKRTEVDLDGMQLEGELRSPGEFYFQHKPEEKFDSLVKRRKNFHREMLRDAVSGK